MANVFFDLPVPAGNGSGGAVDVSTMGGVRTVTSQGDLVGALIIEVSNDGTTFVPLFTFSGPGKRTFRVSSTHMRVTVNNFVSGTANVDVAAEDAGVTVATLVAPAGDGVGASVDVSALGALNSIIVTGVFTGQVIIQISEDGVDFVDCLTFTRAQLKSKNFIAQFMRIRRQGVVAPAGTPTIAVGAANEGSGGSSVVPSSVVQFGTTPGTTQVFVDSVNGDDSNAGTSAGDALATIAEVYRKYPMYGWNGRRVVVNLLNDGLVQSTYPINNLWVGGGEAAAQSYKYISSPLFVPAVLATGPSTAALDVVTPAERVDQAGAPAAGGNRTRLNFTVAAPGWTINDLASKHCRITRGGSKLVFEMPISINDADQLIIDNGALAALILATDTVEIVEGGAVIEGDVSNFGICSLVGSGFAAGLIASGGFSDHTFTGIEFTFGPDGRIPYGCTFDRCRMASANWSDADQVGWINCSHVGSFNFSGFTLPVAFFSSDPVAPINATVLMGMHVGGIIVGTLFGRLNMPGFMPLGFIGYAALSVLRNLSVYGAGASANGRISIGHAGRLHVDAGVALQGDAITGATDFGVQCAQGGTAQLLPSGDAFETTITGPGGDVSVGGIVVPYGTGVGELDEVAGFNGVASNIPSAPGDLGDASIIRTKGPS